MDWYNEAPEWKSQDSQISMQAAPQTDFWRLSPTIFGGDNGHFYYQRQEGDFLIEVKFRGEYAVTYDQAGIMIREDEKHWLKCGIEFIEGKQVASAVITRDYSDWSMVPLAYNPETLWLRLKREGPVIEIYYALDGLHYEMLRQAYFSPKDLLDVGLMCASPQGTGFTVVFEDLTIQKK